MRICLDTWVLAERCKGNPGTVGIGYPSQTGADELNCVRLFETDKFFHENADIGKGLKLPVYALRRVREWKKR